jgi:hypothetical protein
MLQSQPPDLEDVAMFRDRSLKRRLRLNEKARHGGT